ncbi:putative F-box/LRR-repeat protein 9 [Apium graveolens]|uniref:putative F-box/LRR-repeat protein 9 n=1 Tax=Apium graveolens TaxID=4045 RepID=UPI003D7BB5B3
MGSKLKTTIYLWWVEIKKKGGPPKNAAIYFRTLGDLSISLPLPLPLAPSISLSIRGLNLRKNMKRTLMLFPTERSRNWLDLPDELMTLILARLVTVDRIMIARKVCNTWRRICSDPALWRVVVLEYCISWNIINVAKKAVDLSCGQLIDIRINDIGTDSLLRYISDRYSLIIFTALLSRSRDISNQLRRLHLSSCDNITSEGLSEMFKELPLLEELHLDYTAISPQAIEVAGRYCPLLKSFKLNNHGRLHAFNMNYAGPNEDALAIAKHLPGLRHLQLTGNNMTIVGLVAITENCSHLESLDISDCLNVADQLGSGLRKRLSQQIKDLRLPLHSSRDY